MRTKEIDISIILLNYNTAIYSVDCINSILKKTSEKLSFEIIVIDNASELDDFLKVKTYIESLNNSKISIYRSKINLGFGAGNMYGVQHANGKYYAFVNNDTIFLNDCLSRCFQFMETDETIAVCGPQIFDENKNRIVSFDHFATLGREIFGSKVLELLYPLKKPDRKKIYKNPLKVNYVNGSFIFIRLEAFNKVGGFDTNIFLYFEESDLCYRLLKNGFSTYFLPEAHYIHFEGKSTANNILKKIELKTSLFYVIKKNYGYFSSLILKLYFIIRYFFTCIVKPKYLPLFFVLLQGLPISNSLKQRQKIIN